MSAKRLPPGLPAEVAVPLVQAAGRVAQSLKHGLLEGLGAARARPGVMHVADKNVAAALGAACECIGVPLKVAARLNSAKDAMGDLAGRFRR